MSAASSSLPYKLRPNKAVDRELFLLFLHRISGSIGIEKYKYIGLGGPFMEDFRLLHARIGINKMVCVELLEEVHKRQEFNKPFKSITCVHSKMEDYLAETEFDAPVVLWLDFDCPRETPDAIATFRDQAMQLPDLSILRITLNANPTSLGNPSVQEVEVPELARSSQRQTLQEWRLEKFKNLFSNCPTNLQPGDMVKRNYGKALLSTLHLEVESALLDVSRTNSLWTLATHYADGQPMVTATLIVLDEKNPDLKKILRTWEFFSSPKKPLVIDIPALSTLERLTLESSKRPRSRMRYDLPKSDLNEDPFLTFKKYYRVFPHFAKVDM